MVTTINFSKGNQETYDFAEGPGFQKELAEYLSRIPAPNDVSVSCAYGTASYQIIKKGSTSFIRCVSNNMSIPDAGDTLPSVYLTKIDPEYNNYKYYKLEQIDRNTIRATYGRIGADARDRFGERTHEYSKDMYYVKLNEKLAKGYVDQSKIYLNTKEKKKKGETKTVEKPKKKERSETGQENVAAELYRKLIAFSRKHVETCCMSAVVTAKMVSEARKYLNILYQRKTVKGFNSNVLKLIAISPRRVQNVQDLLAVTTNDFARIIGREEDLLAAMEVLVGKTFSNVQKREDTFDGIEVYQASEEQKKHVMDHLSLELKGKVRQIYRIVPQEQQKKFDAYLEKNNISKVIQLWHGSKNENWASIIQHSLQLHPNAAITGKMFGDGIYFAPSSMKSWNYTSYRGTSWARGTSDVAYMGLYAVAYGEPLDVYTSYRYSQTTLQGKNCVHAHAGQALRNDEIVFYSEDAMVLNYIVEFG